MKTFCNSIFALLVIVCATAIATPGVNMTVSFDPSGFASASITGAPDGSYIEAVVDVGGMSFVVDAAPVANGTAAVMFPGGTTNDRVVLNDPAGNVLETVFRYEGITEND